MKALIIDTETTGLKEPEVIELAYAEITVEDLLVVSTSIVCTTTRYRSTKKIEYGAMAVHHILPESLEQCAASSTCKLPGEFEYLIGHNVDFDWVLLGKPKGKRIDTLALCRYLWPECDSHSQSAMLYFLNGATEITKEILKGAHSAGTDVYICYRVLSYIVAKVNMTAPVTEEAFEALWVLSEKARIPSIMYFGKYKGIPIKDVPKDYCMWYSRQVDTDAYLLKAFQLAGKIK